MRPALDGLAGIISYLADKDPDAADRLIARLRQCAASLATRPEQGRPSRLDSARELVVAGTSYVLFYRIKARTIEIIPVHQTRQQWPPKV
jgi:toxin ParE1/3/4